MRLVIMVSAFDCIISEHCNEPSASRAVNRLRLGMCACACVYVLLWRKQSKEWCTKNVLNNYNNSIWMRTHTQCMRIECTLTWAVVSKFKILFDQQHLLISCHRWYFYWTYFFIMFNAHENVRLTYGHIHRLVHLYINAASIERKSRKRKKNDFYK